MLKSNWLLLLLAIVIGGGVAVLSNNYIHSRIQEAEEELKRSQGMVKVVVARDELKRGTKLTPEMLANRDIPQKYVHKDAVRPEDYSGAVGQRLTSDLHGGESLLWAQLEGNNPVFSAHLTPGQRGITFAVDEINSVSGMLTPGDQIDLIATLKQKDWSGKERDVTFPLLQNVLILATGQQAGRTGDDSEEGKKRTFSTITLQTTPLDANRIIVAQDAGKLTAVLRHPDDEAPVALTKLDASALIGENTTTPGKPEVEIIYGGMRGGEGRGSSNPLTGAFAPPANTAPAPAPNPPADKDVPRYLPVVPLNPPREGTS